MYHTGIVRDEIIDDVEKLRSGIDQLGGNSRKLDRATVVARGDDIPRAL